MSLDLFEDFYFFTFIWAPISLSLPPNTLFGIFSKKWLFSQKDWKKGDEIKGNKQTKWMCVSLFYPWKYIKTNRELKHHKKMSLERHPKFSKKKKREEREMDMNKSNDEMRHLVYEPGLKRNERERIEGEPWVRTDTLLHSKLPFDFQLSSFFSCFSFWKRSHRRHLVSSELREAGKRKGMKRRFLLITTFSSFPHFIPRDRHHSWIGHPIDPADFERGINQVVHFVMLPLSLLSLCVCVDHCEEISI